jgi:OFA family oxalate/formate antiporter-like MFS transporter
VLAEEKRSGRTINNKSGIYYGYIIVLASFLILMMTYGSQYSYGVFFTPLLKDFGWSRAVTSGAYSLNLIVFGIFSVITGRINDKFGPRLVVTICGVLIGLGYLLMATVNDVWQIYLFYGVIISIGVAGMWVPLLTTAARWFTRKKGLASGVIVAGIGVGTAIMPPVANKLIVTYAWRTSYLIIGSAAMILIVSLAQFLKRAPGQLAQVTDGADSLSRESRLLQVSGISFRKAIITGQFWMIFGISFCQGFWAHTALVHIVARAQDLKIPSAAAAAVMTAIGIISIGSKVGTGGIGDRIGFRRAMIIIYIIASIAFLWLLQANNLWTLYLFAVLFGLAYGGISASHSPFVAEFFGLKDHGTIFGLMIVAFGLGGASGPFLASRIFDISGSYTWAFLFCVVMSVSGLILLWLLKPAIKHTAKL